MAKIGYMHGENIELDHIPGSDGWPIVGNTLKFFEHIYELGAELREAHGEVYRNRAFFMRFLTFASPDGAEFLLRDPDKNFSSKLGWEPFLKRLYPNTLGTMDFAEHRFHRQSVQSVFRPVAMAGYADMINETVADNVQRWPTEQRLQLYPKIKAMILATAAKVFLGLDLASDVEYIMQRFKTLDKGMVTVVQYPVPGLSLWKAMRAREEIFDYFRPLIAERRTSQRKDMFTQLCQSVDEHGDLLPEQAILDNLLGVYGAASETTTGSLTIAMYYLARYPEWQERLRATSMAIGPGPIPSEQLGELVEHEHVFFEAMRVRPVTPQVFRRSVRDCEFKGLKIPAGTQAVVDIGYIHRSALYWTDPLTFDPTRFAEPRAEQRRHKYQWIPFGGGAHVCIGQFFAVMFAKMALHQLLTKYRFELSGTTDLKLNIMPTTYPKDGLRMKLFEVGDPARSAAPQVARCPVAHDRPEYSNRAS